MIRARLIGLAEEPPRRLANERELCRIHGVSRITIRRALDILQAEGLIDRTRKRGTITVPAGIRAWRRLRRSRLIKVITSHVAQSDRVTSLYGVIHQGIFSRAGRHGYSVATRHVQGPFPAIGPDYSPEKASDIVGAIMTAVPDERMIAMHVDAGYPVVCAGYWPRNPKADGVVADCFSEGQAAVEFLLGQGHSNIFYLGNLTGKGADEQHEADADLMVAGCRRALVRAGLTLPAEHVRFCRAIPEHAAEAAAWYRSLPNRPTAGVVFSYLAMDLFREAMARYGIHSPRDVSLITKGIHGDSLDAAAMRFDAFGLGEWAVDLLLDRASGRRLHQTKTGSKTPRFRRWGKSDDWGVAQTAVLNFAPPFASIAAGNTGKRSRGSRAAEASVLCKFSSKRMLAGGALAPGSWVAPRWLRGAKAGDPCQANLRFLLDCRSARGYVNTVALRMPLVCVRALEPIRNATEAGHLSAVVRFCWCFGVGTTCHGRDP